MAEDSLTFHVGIACDSEGNVYVADRHNHRIQVFTSEGIFLRMFGKYGEGSGELKRPMAVAVGSDNVVYVSEWDNHRRICVQLEWCVYQVIWQ